MTPQPIAHWYREPTMMIVAGVLLFTLISGIAMLTFALSHRDTLVMSPDDYTEWRDDIRATKPIDDD